MTLDKICQTTKYEMADINYTCETNKTMIYNFMIQNLDSSQQTLAGMWRHCIWIHRWTVRIPDVADTHLHSFERFTI